MAFGQNIKKKSQKPLGHSLTLKMLLHHAHPHQGHPKERKRQKKGSQVECPKP
jgi:hypothetical protein